MVNPSLSMHSSRSPSAYCAVHDGSAPLQRVENHLVESILIRVFARVRDRHAHVDTHTRTGVIWLQTPSARIHSGAESHTHVHI